MCCDLGQLDARQTNRHANRARAAKENHMYAFLGAKARFLLLLLYCYYNCAGRQWTDYKGVVATTLNQRAIWGP